MVRDGNIILNDEAYQQVVKFRYSKEHGPERQVSYQVNYQEVSGELSDTRSGGGFVKFRNNWRFGGRGRNVTVLRECANCSVRLRDGNRSECLILVPSIMVFLIGSSHKSKELWCAIYSYCSLTVCNIYMA